MEKMEPIKIQTSEGVKTGAQKIEKAEPEKIQTLGTEKCKKRSLKNRKSGACKEEHAFMVV